MICMQVSASLNYISMYRYNEGGGNHYSDVWLRIIARESILKSYHSQIFNFKNEMLLKVNSYANKNNNQKRNLFLFMPSLAMLEFVPVRRINTYNNALHLKICVVSYIFKTFCLRVFIHTCLNISYEGHAIVIAEAIY